MGEKADSYLEIRTQILEKIEKGDPSIEGLMNKIQGQMGENAFEKAANGAAHLAESGSQAGYDLYIPKGNTTQFIQAKVYKSPQDVIEKMRDVNTRTAQGSITAPDGTSIENIDFAVNSEIYEDVKELAAQEGLPNQVLNLGASREEIRDLLNTSMDMAASTPLDGFFSDVLGGVVTGGALHCAVNGFLVAFSAKERGDAIEDIVHHSLATGGGVVAGASAEATVALTAETLLIAEMETVAAFITGPIGAAVVFGVGLGSRSLIKRFSNRRYLEKTLSEGNQKIRSYLSGNHTGSSLNN